MKVLFVESKRKDLDLNIEKIEVPKKLHILYSIQYKELAEKIRDKLKKEHEILDFQQILGCSVINPKGDLLLIGSGRFHGISIAYNSGKPVWVYDNGKIDKIKQEEIEKYRARRNAKISRFLMADNIGLIVTSKLGQNKIEEALKFKEEMQKKYKDKKFYIFVSETININEFENFPIDIWINFACPGLELDNKDIINYEHII